MKKQRKKEFPVPTEANSDGEISVQDELDAKHPFAEEDNFAGDSVDEHKELEAANEYFAKKEISQQDNNS